MANSDHEAQFGGQTEKRRFDEVALHTSANVSI